LQKARDNVCMVISVYFSVTKYILILVLAITAITLVMWSSVILLLPLLTCWVRQFCGVFFMFSVFAVMHCCSCFCGYWLCSQSSINFHRVNISGNIFGQKHWHHNYETDVTDSTKPISTKTWTAMHDSKYWKHKKNTTKLSYSTCQ
jgi:hypothetical protein